MTCCLRRKHDLWSQDAAQHQFLDCGCFSSCCGRSMEDQITLVPWLCRRFCCYAPCRGLTICICCPIDTCWYCCNCTDLCCVSCYDSCCGDKLDGRNGYYNFICGTCDENQLSIYKSATVMGLSRRNAYYLLFDKVGIPAPIQQFMD
jgi:hypothetical protein